MDRVSYDGKITDMLQRVETYTQLRTNPLTKTQKNPERVHIQSAEKNKVTTGDAFKLKSSDAIIPRLSGLPKVHNDAIPLRPIVSFIGSATYNLSKLHPGQEASLAPPFSNLRTSGSKCTLLKNVHVTLLEFFGIPAIIRRPRSISAPPE